MSTAVAEAKSTDPDESAQPDAAGGKPAKSGSGKKKLLLLGVPVLLAGAGAGLWFSGLLPHWLGMDKPAAAAAEAHGAAPPVEAKAALPTYVELPEMVANLNTGTRRTSYVKLRARLELSKPADDATLKAMMPRLMDLFQTYLRDMRPEELQGSAGSYRLREELIARANIALAPMHVTDVLFTEMLVQ